MTPFDDEPETARDDCLELVCRTIADLATLAASIASDRDARLTERQTGLAITLREEIKEGAARVSGVPDLCGSQDSDSPQ